MVNYDISNTELLGIMKSATKASINFYKLSDFNGTTFIHWFWKQSML